MPESFAEGASWMTERRIRKIWRQAAFAIANALGTTHSTCRA